MFGSYLQLAISVVFLQWGILYRSSNVILIEPCGKSNGILKLWKVRKPSVCNGKVAIK